MSRYELGAIVQRLSGTGKITRVPLLFSGLIFLGGCSESTSAPEPSDRPDMSVSGAPPAQADRRPQEERFRRISDNVPGFGGYFFEGDALVGLVTDLASAASVRAALRPILSQPGTPSGVSRVEIRKGEYSFIQLREWRDRASGEVLAIADASWVDLDEKRNRLAIGLENRSGRAAVNQKLAELDIPPAAVIIEVTGLIGEDVGFRRSHTIRDYNRPLEGGISVDMTYPGSSFPCTFGFNARWNNQNVFVTNSHCTEVFWGGDNTTVYQPSSPGQAYWVGNEVHDPDPFRCGPIWDRDDCRYSDAAMISIELSLFGNNSFNFGYIARTTSRTEGFGGVGSIVIDHNNPRMEIIAENLYSTVGQSVHKMGRFTGWTYGDVTQTCVDREAGNIVRKCQDFADYGRGGGDSGSPVFLWHGSTVTLQGIHWGYNTGLQVALFSPLGGIKQDLGSFTTFTPPPPPLSVFISGPDEVPPDEYCTWQASVTGGTAPYSYSWSGALSGSGSSVSGSISQSSWLYLTVTDAGQNQDSNQIFITVDEELEECEW